MPRLFKEKEVDVYKKVFFKNDIQAKIATFGSEEVVLFKDRMVSVSQSLIYLHHQKCLEIKKGNEIQEKNFFLCKNKLNQNFVFTDKRDIEVIIDDDDLHIDMKVNEAQLVQEKDYYYVSLGIGEDMITHVLLTFKFNYLDKLDLVESKILSFSPILRGVGVSSMMMGLRNNHLIFFLHSKYQHFIQIVEYSTINDHITKVHDVLLDQSVDIIKVQFFSEEENFGCFFVSQEEIVEVKLEANGAQWSV